MGLKFEQLNEAEQVRIRKTANEWLQKNKNHVYRLIEEDKNKVAPKGSDLYNPSIWKPMNWRWYLDNSFLL